MEKVGQDIQRCVILRVAIKVNESQYIAFFDVSRSID